MRSHGGAVPDLVQRWTLKLLELTGVKCERLLLFPTTLDAASDL